MYICLIKEKRFSQYLEGYMCNFFWCPLAVGGGHKELVQEAESPKWNLIAISILGIISCNE